MKIEENYPVYHDPTFEECVELAKSHWDTLRIMTYKHRDNQEVEHLVVGSGYGNTHFSLIVATRKHINGGRREMWDVDTYILYRKGPRAYFNLEDVSGHDCAGFCEWAQYFISEHINVLRDIIRESGLEVG